MLLTILLAAAASAADLDAQCEVLAKKAGYETSVEHGSGQGRWATWDSTRVLRRGRRNVELKREGGGGLPVSTAVFGPAGEGAPTKAERALLLSCEGFTPYDRGDPRDVFVSLDELGLGVIVPNEWETAEFLTRWPTWLLHPRDAKDVPQRDSWKPATFPWVAETGHTCPCFEIFRGSDFGPLRRIEGGLWDGAAPPAPWVVQMNSVRNTTFVVGVRRAGGTVRWLGTHYGPVHVLGEGHGRSWIAASGPLAGGGFSLYAIDLRTNQLTPYTVELSFPEPPELQPGGILLKGGDAPRIERLVTWEEFAKAPLPTKAPPEPEAN